MRRDQHLGRRLQVDDQLRARHAFRQQRVELLVHEQLAVLEVQVGEEPALLEHVVGDGRVREEVASAAAPAAGGGAAGGRRAPPGTPPPAARRRTASGTGSVPTPRAARTPPAAGSGAPPPPSCPRRSRLRPRCTGSSSGPSRFRRRAAPRARVGAGGEQGARMVAPSRGWTQVGRQVAQRHQDEPALVHPRVGQGEAGLVPTSSSPEEAGRGRGCAAHGGRCARGRAPARPAGRPRAAPPATATSIQRATAFTNQSWGGPSTGSVR